jgi:methionyl-tRNA formyltransferase
LTTDALTGSRGKSPIANSRMAGLRIIFMGTPGLAGASLEALLRTPALAVVAVVTQPDRARGRQLKLQPSPVKEIAGRAGLPVLQPEKARDDAFISELRRWQPDLIAVAAFGRILPKSILALPRFGCLNVHTSLLPKYRGAAPIQWAILNDEPETGVTIMRMDAGLDTGDILTQQATPIRTDDNAETLHDRLAQIGAQLLVQTIPDYVAGKILPRPQQAELATYAPKIGKRDGWIDWRLPARTIWNRVRAFTPWPGAFTFLPGVPSSGGAAAAVDAPLESAAPNPPQLLKIWRAEVVRQNGSAGEILGINKAGLVIGCGQNALSIVTLQREGGRRMSAQEFLAGHPLLPGQKLISASPETEVRGPGDQS